MTNLKLTATNFRTFEHLDWRPEGVCALAGANGAGKTTTLDAFRFVSTFFRKGPEEAFRAVDGVAFRRLEADPDSPVEFSIEIADLVWKLRFPVSAQAGSTAYGEELSRGGEMVFRAAMFQNEWFLDQTAFPNDPSRCRARVLWDRGEAGWMQPLVDSLSGIRVYQSYQLDLVKRIEPVGQGDTILHGTGKNLWSVLANWKGAPIRYRDQFNWVMTEAKRAFPDLLGTVEIDRGLPYLFRPGATDPADGLLPNRAADGLLTVLLHLTAMASETEGSLLAFDEIENHLHPHAIRSLLATMRKRAEERNFTVIVTTHSPVVLNGFRDEPQQVFVLDHSLRQPALPVPLTELHTEEWLAQAKLGSLYERLAFGSPVLESRQ